MSADQHDDFQSDAQSDIEFSNAQWANRRRIAFVSLYAAIALTFFVITASLVSDAFADRLDKFQMFLATGVTGFFGLAGAYMGFATWSDVKTPTETPSQRRERQRNARPPVPPSPTEDESQG